MQEDDEDGVNDGLLFANVMKRYALCWLELFSFMADTPYTHIMQVAA